jgi:hypothetical protein
MLIRTIPSVVDRTLRRSNNRQYAGLQRWRLYYLQAVSVVASIAGHVEVKRTWSRAMLVRQKAHWILFGTLTALLGVAMWAFVVSSTANLVSVALVPGAQVSVRV